MNSLDLLVPPNATNLLTRLNRFTTQPSAPGDPVPIKTANNGSVSTWAVNGPKSEMLFVLIKVSRFWRWALVSAVLPIILCAMLGMLVFFQDPAIIGSRLSVLVTLFLALTAVQFVIWQFMPRSSYVSRVCTS